MTALVVALLFVTAGPAQAQKQPLEEMYRAWMTSQGDARFKLAIRLVTDYFGTLEAERAAYEGLFSGDDDQKVEMARLYIDVDTRRGATARYTEFAYLYVVQYDPNPLDAFRHTTEYLADYPHGRFRQQIEGILSNRCLSAISYAVKIPLGDAVHLIEAVEASHRDELALTMASRLSQQAVVDMCERGDKSEFTHFAAGVAHIGLRLIQPGMRDVDSRDASAALRELNLALGLGLFFEASRRDYADVGAYDEARAALEKAIGSPADDPLDVVDPRTRIHAGSTAGHFFLAKLDDRCYDILRSKYEQLGPNALDLEEGRVLENRASERLRTAVANYILVGRAAYVSAVDLEEVKRRLDVLYPILYPQNPDGWTDEIGH